MSMLVPVLLVGIIATTAIAMDNPSTSGPVANPTITASRHASLQNDVVGVGAYLKGAVADLGGSPATALSGYLAALSEDPDNMDLRQRAFELSLMSGDVPTAIRLARSMPESQQSSITHLVQMADDARDGKLDKAREQAREIAKVSPELLQFRLLQAYLDHAARAPMASLIPWLETTPTPGSMAGRRDYHLARLMLQEGQPTKALEYLRRAHQAEPGAVTSTLLLGQTLARQGRAQEGAVVFDSFRAENPSVALLVPPGSTLLASTPPAFTTSVEDDLAATLSDFALLVWSQGAIGPARQVMNLSLWLNPDDVYTRYYSALLLEMGNDQPAAQAEYDRILKTGVHDDFRLAVQIRLAEVQYQMGGEDEAYKTIRKLAAKNPKVAPVQRSLAQMAFNREDFALAAESYGRILATLPETTPTDARVELLFARGAALERAGNEPEATVNLLEALKLAPTNAQVMNYLGYMWVDKGVRIPEAFALLQKAHLLEPTDGAITDSLGWAYYKRGDYQTASQYLARATEQDPESPEIYDHLGDAYDKLGRKLEARREWQRALDLVAAGKQPPNEDFTDTVKKKLR